MTVSDSENRPSQTKAWLGFGFSLAAFLLVCLLLIIAFVRASQYAEAAKHGAAVAGGGFMGVTMLVVLIVIPLLVLGLIFSIKGLNYSRKHALKKWPSACGIILSCLIFLSFFLPLIASTFSSPEPVEVQLPESPASTAVNGEEESYPNGLAVLYIDSYFELKCSYSKDGRKGSVANMTIDSGLKHQFETWMSVNSISKDAEFRLSAAADAKYDNVVMVIDMLRDLGITNYAMYCTLSPG